MFSAMSLSVILLTGGPNVTIIHYALDLNIQVRLSVTPTLHMHLTVQGTPWTWGLILYGDPPGPGLAPPSWPLNRASDIWWPILETCWNLFTWGPQVLKSSGQDWRSDQTCLLEEPTPCPVQASSGHWSMYGWRPVRILLECFLVYEYKCSFSYFAGITR